MLFAYLLRFVDLTNTTLTASADIESKDFLIVHNPDDLSKMDCFGPQGFSPFLGLIPMYVITSSGGNDITPSLAFQTPYLPGLPPT